MLLFRIPLFASCQEDMDFRRTILTRPNKELRSRIVFLIALAASSFSAAPARASFSFKVDQVPLEKGGAGNLIEPRVTKQAAVVPIKKSFVENSSPNLANSPYSIAGASPSGADGRRLISAQRSTAPIEVVPCGSRPVEDYGEPPGSDDLNSATPTRNTAWVAAMSMAALVLLGSNAFLRLARRTYAMGIALSAGYLNNE